MHLLEIDNWKFWWKNSISALNTFLPWKFLVQKLGNCAFMHYIDLDTLMQKNYKSALM